VATTLKQAAYEHIRRMLLLGELEPGDRLSNRGLAEEIGVSVIPVREAISQLASEGLVEHRPGQGSFVAQTHREEIEELYDLRQAVECHAVERVAEGADEAHLAEMQGCINAMTRVIQEAGDPDRSAWGAPQAERWVQADSAFHLALLRAAGNRRAVKLLHDLRAMTHLFFGYRTLSHTRADARRVVQEHQRILDALRRGDAAAARECMVAHLRRGCRDALAAYERRRLDRAVTQTPIQRDHKA
jgi:DNA-binding GntR family transcriptional regulator